MFVCNTPAFRAAQYVRMSTEHQQYSTHNQADKIQEYICKRKGIAVAYVAEQFENHGSPLSTIVKGVKRAMAGEYSRELSAKVFAGQCRLIEMGFRQGGTAGFGLRRVLIEPLSVIQPDRKKPEYLVLDGHLRALALKELGMSVGPCLFARDDETYSYNRHVNRLSTIAEHYMIRRAIDWGVSNERLARELNINLSSINRLVSQTRNLLEGICPEAITLLQDKQFFQT